MNIEFSEHAKDQNKKRKIPIRWIKETVVAPNEIAKSYRNREIRKRQFDGKILEVITVKENNSIVIVTQYFVEETEL